MTPAALSASTLEMKNSCVASVSELPKDGTDDPYQSLGHLIAPGVLEIEIFAIFGGAADPEFFEKAYLNPEFVDQGTGSDGRCGGEVL